METPNPAREDQPTQGISRRAVLSTLAALAGSSVGSPSAATGLAAPPAPAPSGSALIVASGSKAMAETAAGRVLLPAPRPGRAYGVPCTTGTRSGAPR